MHACVATSYTVLLLLHNLVWLQDLKFPLCLYREAIRFPPTRYVRGAVTRTYECDNHYPIRCSMHASRHCGTTSYSPAF